MGLTAEEGRIQKVREGKGYYKVNIVEGTLNPPESANIANEHVKQPTLTKSARGSSSNNRGRLVAPRDNGKSPRGQD